MLVWLNVVLGVGKSCLAFRDFSSSTTHFRPAYCIRLLYVAMEYVKHKFYDGMKNRAQTFGDGAYKLTRAEAAKLLELLTGAHRTSCYRSLSLDDRFYLSCA
jgi:hypothetical protein